MNPLDDRGKASKCYLFSYLTDMSSVDGSADAAVTTRSQCGWNKFRELFSYLRSNRPSLGLKG